MGMRSTAVELDLLDSIAVKVDLLVLEARDGVAEMVDEGGAGGEGVGGGARGRAGGGILGRHDAHGENWIVAALEGGEVDDQAGDRGDDDGGEDEADPADLRGTLHGLRGAEGGRGGGKGGGKECASMRGGVRVWFLLFVTRDSGMR